jgi:uncharacterized protein (DUF2062 family)
MLTSPRVKRWLEQLLHTHDTPRRTAAAYAVGVFFGFSPFLGLHTVLGLFFAFLLNLNRVAVVLGVYSNLPWILPAYYTIATVAGAALLRVDVSPDLTRDMTEAATLASWREFWQMIHTLTPLVWAYTLGSTLGALALAAVAYRLSLALILTHRQHAHKAPESSEL